MNMNHTTGRSKPAARLRQVGFTLVELMIAMTISLMVLVAMVALLVNLSSNNKEMARTNSQIENGRFAIQILQSDIMQAGFWASFIPQFDDLSTTAAPTDVPTAVPAPCLVHNAMNWDAAYISNVLGIAIQAYDAVPTGCGGALADKKADTDVLLVRRADTCIPGDANCDAETAGMLYFQASDCESELTAVPAQRYVLDTANFTLRKRGCAAADIAEKRKFISSIYYIRDYAVTSGDGIPTLVRSQFDLAGGTLGHQAAVPLIEGVEGFRVELGIDNVSESGVGLNAASYSSAVTWTDTTRTVATNRGDGSPDGAFVRCTSLAPCTADQLMNVVAVKAYVLARSKEKTPGHTDNKTYSLGSTTLGPFNDGYKRHVFSTTIRLVNISGRRETP